RPDKAGIHPSRGAIHPARRVGLKMEGATNHRQANRNISKPVGKSPEHHRVEEMGLHNVEALAYKNLSEAMDAVEEPVERAGGRKIETERKCGDPFSCEPPSKSARSLRYDCRHVATVMVSQLAELLHHPGGPLGGGRDMTHPNPTLG